MAVKANSNSQPYLYSLSLLVWLGGEVGEDVSDWMVKVGISERGGGVSLNLEFCWSHELVGGIKWGLCVCCESWALP